MELHHLRYFVAVAEERHFGRAAQRLHVTQPPVSQRIKDLERELGTKLLERTNQGVLLTEAGAILLEHARNVLASVDAAVEAMRKIRRGPQSVLHAGIPPDTAPITFSTMFRQFRERVPDVLLQISELSTAEQLERLRGGELDVAVVRRPADFIGLESSPQVVCPLGVWLSAQNPLSKSPVVRASDLNGLPLVIFPRSMAPEVYDQMLSTCRDHGFLPSTIHHVRNPSFVWGLVESDLGVHLNHEFQQRATEGVVFRPIESTPLAWRTSVVWMPQRRTEVTDAFCAAALSGLVDAGYLSLDQLDRAPEEHPADPGEAPWEPTP